MPTIIKTLKDMFGNQIIPRTKTNAVALSDGSLLNTYEDYIRGGGGIKPQIVVTAPAGAVVTCTDGTVTFTGVSTGTYTFYLPHFGTYTVSSVLEYQTSPIQTVVVDTVTIYRVSMVHFVAHIEVTVPEGSALTCRNGAITLTGTSTGVYTFLVRAPGPWTITATLNDKTIQRIIEVSNVSDQVYPVTLEYYVVYGVRIDTTNTNPVTSVSYIEGTDSFDMSKGSTDWDTKPLFRTIKPCIMVNGNVTTYLNPNNFAQSTSGNAVDISANSTGDVMIEFGKGGYKFVRNGNYLEIYVTDNPNAKDQGYVYHPFSYSTEGDCDHFWWGAYLASTSSTSLLRSVSGAVPLTNISLVSSRNAARSRGAGYELPNFFQLLWIQILYVVKYGALNSQATLGGGYTYSLNTAPIGTGTTNTMGMNYGTPGEYNSHVKLFGIEDFYGNCKIPIDGMQYATNYILYVNYPGYNGGYQDIVEGYKFILPIGDITTEGAHTYIKSVQGTNETGFITAKDTAADQFTYYTDTPNVRNNSCVYFGGSYNSAERAGVFHLEFVGYFTQPEVSLSARLSYCLAGK